MLFCASLLNSAKQTQIDALYVARLSSKANAIRVGALLEESTDTCGIHAHAISSIILIALNCSVRTTKEG